MNHAQYDQKKIDALASELMEPQRLADGGPPDVPPTSKFRKAAAAVQAARSIGDEPLEGAPTRANVPNIGEVMLGKNREAEEAARRASAMSGVPYRPTTRFAPLDVDRATRIAREYDLMKHDPDDPLVKMAYDQMIKETNDQYEAMLQAGIEPYFIEPGNNPYRNSPYEALLDVAENRRIGVFPSVEGFGTDPNFNPQGNPLLQETGRLISGRPALANDLFRAVHDYFGHAKPGVGFRAAGEENAYQSHAGMFSPLARRALASETRGQNSYLNYGPYGETNRTAKIEDTRFADQKAGLMPRWASEAGLVINDDRRREFFDNLARNQTGLEGAISDDGKLRLVHYSTRPLERIDPEFYGRGLSRASLAERNRSYDPEFVKRSYYGIPASEKPYVPEFGLGGIRNEVLIEPELIYQAQANPEGLWIRNDPTGSERRIAEAGYTGYYSTDPKLGKVAVIFDPYDVSKSYMIPVGAVGAGAMAMSGEDELETMAGGGAIRKAAEAVRQAADSDLDMSTEGVAPADIKKSFIVNPKSLIFRETEQSQANKDSLTGDSDDFDPIVVIGNDLKNLSILDGHHRASVARDRGDSLQAVRVTESEYDLLKKKGFDDTEIAYAALQRANKGYAAGNLDSQFKGSGIADNGDRAWDELLSEDDPEGMSKGGLVDKLRSAASSVKEAGNVYKAAVGNMFSPWEPREERLPGLYPSDWEYPELRLRRPGIVNLALGMPNMAADMRYLFGAVKDAAIGDEVPDEEWRKFDIASEAQGRYEEDMDSFLRSYTGKSMDELSGPMSAVLGLSEAAAQPGIISAKVVAGLPRLARYLSHLAEFATPVTVASPGAMTTGAVFNAGIRALPALTDGDDLEQMNARYSGRELSGEEQDRLDDYLQELLGKKDGGLIDRINQSFYENISKPAVGTAIDMTLGLGDLAQMAARYLGNKAGFDAGEFTSVAQPVKEAIGVDDYNPYTIGGVGASILPFAAAGRTAQAINAAPAGVRQIQAALPNLGRESAAYVGAEAAGAGAREFMPDSPMAELFANVAGGMGGSALGSQPTSMGIIKEKGGNWISGEIEDELGLLHNTNQGMRADTPARQLAEIEARFPPESLATLPQHTREFVQQNIDQLRSRAQIDNWIDSKLNKYIRNDMATQSDPIRLHAESFQAEKAENLARKDEQIARAMDNLERTRLERGVTANDLTRSQAQIRELQRERALIAAQTGLHINPDEVGINRYLAEDFRKDHGYPQLGATRTARAWEDASDVAVFPSTAGTHLTFSADSVLDDNPWLAKIPPESKTYEMRQTGYAHNFRGLGFDHMMDELRNATAPNSDLPENLRIDPNDLSGMSVPEIVKKIDKINAWRYVNRAEVDAVRANNAATIPFKEYDAVPYRSEPNTEGLKWVQLARTEDTPEADAALNDALEYEGSIMNHSVGGYRTPDRGGSQDYGLGGWDAITSDRARIYSLRDASGKPHATIEVLSNPVRYNDIVREVGIKTASEMSNRGMTVEQMAQAIPNFKMPARITQIKGLNNKIPEEQYLPFVQDFVLGQDWSDIGDFHHTGLKKLYSDSDLAKAMRDAGQTPPEYVTNEELTQLHRQYPVGYAQGGLVYDADAINALAAQLMEPQGYAGGGAIRKAAEAVRAESQVADDPVALTPKTQTETPEFKNWFGNSAITRSLEPNGKPRRLYHITPKNFEAFDVNRPDAAGAMSAESGPVIFMTDDPEKQPAAHNVGGFEGKFKEGTNVMPLYASIQNPLFIDKKSKAAERSRFNLGSEWPYLFTQEDVSKLQDAGYDGVFLTGEYGPNEIVAFRPEQVKSAISNEGTFDPTNPVITKAKGGLVYDANRINALANELMEPVRLSEGGPPPRSRIARAAAAIRGAATPPREIPDEQRVSDEEMMRIARDLGVDVDETDILTDMPMPSITQYTAADRAAAGRRAASLISTQHPIKASEALGRLMEQGFRRTATTQADRTIVGDGNIGGPNFPVLGMVDPEYAGRSWGVMTKGPATTLIRQSSPETAWTTMLGSADQLRSNQLVFDDLRDAFVSSMRQGNLTPDLESRFNHNLRLILGEDANVRDPDIWSRANTFAKRGEVAKLMMGIGISPKKGGVPLGGERSGKGVIFNPSEILKRQTEPSLLHPTQGGTVPTYALGPRMFTIEDSADYRPDLHPGFPMLLKGRDLGLNVIPTPTEVYLPDWHRNFREVMGGRTPPRKAPPGRYDLASGLQGQGLPAQDLTDDYIRHLIREGFAKGGLANYRDMIRSN
jgi:hypothetical protein